MFTVARAIDVGEELLFDYGSAYDVQGMID